MISGLEAQPWARASRQSITIAEAVGRPMARDYAGAAKSFKTGGNEASDGDEVGGVMFERFSAGLELLGEVVTPEGAFAGYFAAVVLGTVPAILRAHGFGPAGGEILGAAA